MSKHELTAQIAHEIYVQRGHAPGRHREDWLAAESIVALCLVFAQALVEAEEARRETAPPRSTESLKSLTPEPSLEERALALLTAAASQFGRAGVAKKLGYKSTSSVGPYLRGQRTIGAKLAERIVANLAPQRAAPQRAAPQRAAPQRAARRAA